MRVQHRWHGNRGCRRVATNRGLRIGTAILATRRGEIINQRQPGFAPLHSSSSLLVQYCTVCFLVSNSSAQKCWYGAITLAPIARMASLCSRVGH